MPPKSKASQGTISFHSKITKPSARSSLKDTKSRISSPLVKSALTNEITKSPTSPVEVKKAAIAIRKEQTPSELAAAKISDAQIRRYWSAREAERKAPRVHQEDLSVDEKILRLFDMSSTYGPCIGMDRMKRWNRAERLGLNPPVEVLAVLLKAQEKGNGKIERAYMDELLNTRPKIEV